MKSAPAILGLILYWLISASASAVPVVWTVDRLEFEDGGSLAGTFTYDAEANTYSEINLVTTAGSIRGSAAYSWLFDSVGDPQSLTVVSSNAADLTGATILGFRFAKRLTSAGGAVATEIGFEATCGTPGCSPPIDPVRFTSSGQISAPAADLGDAFVRSLGDINGDRVRDFAVVTAAGQTAVRDLNGKLVAEFDYRFLPTPVVAVEVLDDYTGNGAPELAILNADRAFNQVLDSLTGGSASQIQFFSAIENGIDMAVYPDINGNGVPELANVGSSITALRVHDANTLQILAASGFGNDFLPVDVEVYPDLDADGLPEVGVLAQNKTAGRAGKLDIRSYSGRKFRRIKLSPLWNVLAQKIVGDLDADGFPEVAILRTEIAGDRAHVAIFSTGPDGGELLRQIPMDPEFPAEQLLALDDISGNGAAEVVVFGRSAGGKQKAIIKDALTGRYIGSAFFSPDIAIEDISLAADINGNGSEELVAVGRRADDGRRVVIIKDSKYAAPGSQDRELIARIVF